MQKFSILVFYKFIYKITASFLSFFPKINCYRFAFLVNKQEAMTIQLYKTLGVEFCKNKKKVLAVYISQMQFQHLEYQKKENKFLQ